MKLFHQIKPELLISWEATTDPLLLHYTGSMFGIGCDARNVEAINKLNMIKNRPADSSYIVLIDSVDSLEKYNVQITPELKSLMEQYSPGALTIVVPCKATTLSHLQINGKIAFRVPEDETLRNFLSSLGIPLISTSINRSGDKPEIDYRNIINNYEDWFDYALVPDDELIAEGEPSTIITQEDDEIICLREGKIPFKQLQDDFYQPVVNFMCTGNICRSPIAEYYFRKRAELRGLKWRSISSGLLQSGVPISENSRIILEKQGIDASKHLSQQISYELAHRSKLVLTMTKNHKKTLLNAGWNNGNIFTLGEFVGNPKDIKDPYHKGMPAYERSFEQIRFYIDILVEKLKAHNES